MVPAAVAAIGGRPSGGSGNRCAAAEAATLRSTGSHPRVGRVLRCDFSVGAVSSGCEGESSDMRTPAPQWLGTTREHSRGKTVPSPPAALGAAGAGEGGGAVTTAYPGVPYPAGAPRGGGQV